MQKRDTLKTLRKRKLQTHHEKLHSKAPIEFHGKRYDSAMIQSLQVPRPLMDSDVDHTLLDIPSAWILRPKRAHKDKRDVTVQNAFTWAVRITVSASH